MRLHINQFCFLSTAPAWLAWLHEFSPQLYADFVEHLRRKPSCRANGEKMLEMLRVITAAPAGEERLEIFLKHTFPHVLIDDQPAPVRTRPAARGPVFAHYDPNLVTIPRRRVLIGTGQDLEQAVLAFLADKVEGDYVLVDGTAYIEYLPKELAHLVGKVPEANWLVRRYRQTTR